MKTHPRDAAAAAGRACGIASAGRRARWKARAREASTEEEEDGEVLDAEALRERESAEQAEPKDVAGSAKRAHCTYTIVKYVQLRCGYVGAVRDTITMSSGRHRWSEY